MWAGRREDGWILRSRLIAWICVTACAPHPTTPSTSAPGRVVTLVMTAEAAPVRSAVSKVASQIAARLPVVVSYNAVVASTLGRPRRSGFCG